MSGESRRGSRLKDASEPTMLPRVLILRVRGRLTQAGHRGDAGIGRREHLGPLGLGPGGEHLAEFRAQPRPSVTVVLVSGVGIVRIDRQQPEQFGEEPGFQRADRHVAAVGGGPSHPHRAPGRALRVQAGGFP